jgi:adenosine deaminase
VRTLTTIFLLALFVAAPAATASERGAAQYLRQNRDDPVRLQAFLYDMPKGGDIHNHLSGAVYAESMVHRGAARSVCVDVLTYFSRSGPCTAGQRPLSDAIGDNIFYNEVLRAWSMKGFRDGVESGHDHFFATFDKFSAANGGQTGDMLAEVTKRAAAQNEQYLETLVTPRFGDVQAIARRVPFDENDLAGTRQRLLDAGLRDVVPKAGADTDTALARQRELLACGTPQADPACDLVVRLQVQGLRAMPKPVVFAQMVFGFELMAADPRWVGFNLVQPEDDPTALADYAAQMRMLGFLRPLYPGGNVTLHAGELVAGLAPPDDLRFHVRMAVEVARAQRIGHGVDIRGERDPLGLLRLMARRGVAIEQALTSNCQVLEVCGRNHPIRLYHRHGVPVALATDDEGVSRTDLTEQYRLAVVRHRFGYRAIKRFARNSLEHSFLARGDKAAVLRTQARAFARFEARFPERSRSSAKVTPPSPNLR